MRTVRRGQYTSTPGKARPAVEPRRFADAAGPDWLVVSAWPPELAALRGKVRGLARRTGCTLALGSIGVGLVDSAVGATTLLRKLRPRAAILVGTAGLYPGHGELDLAGAVVAGDVVLLPEVLPGRHVYLPEIMVRRQAPTRRLTDAIRKATALPAAAVATPLAITRSKSAAHHAARISECALENLEAFAFARAAASLKIPFAVVLGIANHVGPGAHREWKKTAARAAEAACAAVADFLARG